MNNVSYEDKIELWNNYVKNSTLMDDVFMSGFFRDNDKAVERVIQIILENPNLKVVKSDTEYSIKAKGFKGIRLDVRAVDNNGKVYNIEIQNSNEGAVERRTRYNSSLVDITLLSSGETNYNNLPDIYIIFITREDYFKSNLPKYTIEKRIKETGELFDDGSNVIYVNASYKEESNPIGRLIHDLTCVDPYDMYDDILRNTAITKKSSEGGFNMSELDKELLNAWFDEELKRKNKELTEKDKALTEKDKALTEKDNVITEKDNVITEKDKALTEKDNVITEKDKALTEKDESISHALKSMFPAKSIFELSKMFKISEEKVKEYLDRPITDNSDNTNLF